MNTNIQSGILAAFAADALSLGVHWVYDTALIKDRYGRLDKIVKPEIASFHKKKEKGDFTHYGDQMFLLLESLFKCSQFDLDDFAARWQTMFEDYDGYMDGATKETLKNFASGTPPEASGSNSTDLGGASRMVPLALWYAEDLTSFIEHAARQTAMTHNHPEVIDSARFFAITAVEILSGLAPAVALEKAAQKMPSNASISQKITLGLESVEKKTAQAISDFGQMCETDAALPGTIHLIAKYPKDLETALIENIMAGGDSSARGILCGFILGLFNGMKAIPLGWLDEMNAFIKIKAMVGL